MNIRPLFSILVCLVGMGCGRKPVIFQLPPKALVTNAAVNDPKFINTIKVAGLNFEGTPPDFSFAADVTSANAIAFLSKLAALNIKSVTLRTQADPAAEVPYGFPVSDGYTTQPWLRLEHLLQGAPRTNLRRMPADFLQTTADKTGVAFICGVHGENRFSVEGDYVDAAQLMVRLSRFSTEYQLVLPVFVSVPDNPFSWTLQGLRIARDAGIPGFTLKRPQ